MQLSPKIIQSKVEKLADSLGVEVCTLYHSNPTKRVLNIVASIGLDASSLGAELKFSEGLTGKVARERKPVAVRDPASHPEYFHLKGSGEEQFKSYLGIPLTFEEELLGVLVVQTKRTKMFFHSEIKDLYQAGRELVESITGSSTAAA